MAPDHGLRCRAIVNPGAVFHEDEALRKWPDRPCNPPTQMASPAMQRAACGARWSATFPRFTPRPGVPGCQSRSPDAVGPGATKGRSFFRGVRWKGELGELGVHQSARQPQTSRGCSLGCSVTRRRGLSKQDRRFWPQRPNPHYLQDQSSMFAAGPMRPTSRRRIPASRRIGSKSSERATCCRTKP